MVWPAKASWVSGGHEMRKLSRKAMVEEIKAKLMGWHLLAARLVYTWGQCSERRAHAETWAIQSIKRYLFLNSSGTPSWLSLENLQVKIPKWVRGTKLLSLSWHATFAVVTQATCFLSAVSGRGRTDGRRRRNVLLWFHEMEHETEVVVAALHEVKMDPQI